jgi:hypothetical protein
VLQYGQPRHFAFRILHPGSFSVRVVAVVDGSSAVAVTCVDPEPKFPLLTEQQALVSYLQAVGTSQSVTLFLCVWPLDIVSMPHALIPPTLHGRIAERRRCAPDAAGTLALIPRARLLAGLRLVVERDTFAQDLPPASTSAFIAGLHVSIKRCGCALMLLSCNVFPACHSAT